MKVVNIKDIFQTHAVYYRKAKKHVNAQLKKLPKKGSIRKKNIKGHHYYYLAWREGHKVIYKYIGKKNPKELKEQIDQRRELKRQLQIIKDGLYALGLAKRVPRGNAALRFEVFKKDNFTCQYCGRNVKKHKIALTVDHIVPKKRGGLDSMSNFITACFNCNIGKHKTLLHR